jgi:TolB protein
MWLASSLGFVLLGSWAGAEDSAPRLVRLTRDGHFKQRPVWSPDGTGLAFTRHRGTDMFVYLCDAHGAQERRLTDRKEPEFDAVWSPDGRRLALALDKTSPNQGDIEVYTISAQGSDLQAVATGDGKLSHEEWPAWSTDGQWIVFTSTRDDNQEIYRARPDGSERTRLTSDPALDAHPCWSPDGQRIAFATDRWGDLEIALLEIKTGKLQRVTHSPGLDDYPAWSPDGGWIAFSSLRNRNFEVYITSPEADQPANITNHPGWDNFPTWSPTGEITFVSNRDGGFDLYTIEVGKDTIGK